MNKMQGMKPSAVGPSLCAGSLGARLTSSMARGPQPQGPQSPAPLGQAGCWVPSGHQGHELLKMPPLGQVRGVQHWGHMECFPDPPGTEGAKGLVTVVVLFGDVTFPGLCPRLSPPLPRERALRTAGLKR